MRRFREIKNREIKEDKKAEKMELAEFKRRLARLDQPFYDDSERDNESLEENELDRQHESITTSYLFRKTQELGSQIF